MQAGSRMVCRYGLENAIGRNELEVDDQVWKEASGIQTRRWQRVADCLYKSGCMKGVSIFDNEGHKPFRPVIGDDSDNGLISILSFVVIFMHAYI